MLADYHSIWNSDAAAPYVPNQSQICREFGEEWMRRYVFLTGANKTLGGVQFPEDAYYHVKDFHA